MRQSLASEGFIAHLIAGCDKSPCSAPFSRVSCAAVRRFLVAVLALACGHASPKASAQTPGQAKAQPVAADVAKAAAELSEEAHALLRSEGELLWTRWTTGTGAMPSSALAEHPRLSQRESAEVVRSAAARATGTDAAALQLLARRISTLTITREAGAEIEALERARAQLAFAAPGDPRPQHGERDLDRLLTEEPDAKKRAAIALEEAKAAGALSQAAFARDAAVQKAIEAEGLTWQALVEAAHGMPLAELSALAEQTLTATDAVSSEAVASASVRNLGITSDRLRRADLGRLVREAPSDAQFVAGRAFSQLTQVLSAVGAAVPQTLRVDQAPSPSKAARPLALLVDPPQDVRLSLRPAGGFAEERATLHEGARAMGGAMTRTPRWELAQLGDGSAAEGVALLFESLAGDPAWLRETTQLRGDPLDDLVHTEITRRLLSARRAAALLLFEIRRREGPQTKEATAALYRRLLQRATFGVLSDEDAQRWTLQAEEWLPTAPLLLGNLLAAQLELALRESKAVPDAAGPGGTSGQAASASASASSAPPAKAQTGIEVHWWKQPAPQILQLWQGGRSLSALEAARTLGLAAVDPAALARIAEDRLAYTAPDAPPAAQRPDYKYMQGDKKKRRTRRKRHR